MTTTLALLALLLAVLAAARAARARREASEGAAERRRLDARVEEIEARVEALRGLVARMASGLRVDPEMVEEGRLFEEASPEEGAALAARPDALVIDVRTSEEWASGHVPGALHVPLDELPERAPELPRDRTLLVVCAVGVRSAAACEWLTAHGFRRVVNLAGGMSAWPGPVERPGSRWDGSPEGQRSA